MNNTQIKGTAAQVTKKLSQDFDKAVAAGDDEAMNETHELLTISEAIKDVFGEDCQMFAIPSSEAKRPQKEGEK